jgi:hypothetical protein
VAEGGINNVMAVLNLPTNNALDPETLPKCTNNEKKYSDPAADRTNTSSWRHSTIDGGTVDWCGTLVRKDALWYVTSIGNARNPNRTSTNVTRTLEATVTVTPTTTQPLNNPVWNYLYAGHTGSTCDQSLNNNIAGASRMYVAGNLCLSPNVQLNQSTVIVGGSVDVSNNAAIGASTNMSTRVETTSAGPAVMRPAPGRTAAATRTRATSTASSRTWSTSASTSRRRSWRLPRRTTPRGTRTRSRPFSDLHHVERDDTHVRHELPLSRQQRHHPDRPDAEQLVLLPRRSGGELDPQRRPDRVPEYGYGELGNRLPHDAVPDPGRRRVHAGHSRVRHHHLDGLARHQQLGDAHVTGQTVEWKTPSSGEIAWNNTTKTLTVSGTIYIDGSAKISNSALNSYNGQGTIYLSGTFLSTGSLCASISGSNCNFASWNPDFDMLMIVANGNGGQVNPGDSIQIDNNFSYQGGLYGTNAVEFGNNVNVDGPLVGSQILLSNNLTTNAFPNISIVPVGMPSNAEVYAQPNPPQGFTG